MTNSWRFGVLSLLLLAGCDDKPPAEQGFAGMGGQADGYTQVTAGRPFSFPADHAPHPGFHIEWWYVTANLQDPQGRPFGVQWTLFRNALQPGSSGAGWQDTTLWMGHAAATSATSHHAAQRLGRGGVGQAGVSLTPFAAWIDDWSMTSSASEPMRDLHLQASAAAFSYTLHLTSERPMVLQGEHGYSRKSEQGQASYYYSQPFYTVKGQLQIDGQTHQVSGQAWLDREWSSQPLTAEQNGWDWFSLHLQDGTRLMLYRIRRTTRPAYLIGSWIAPDGQIQPLTGDDIRLAPLNETRVAGRSLPTRWSIEIPGKNLSIITEALNAKAWMDLDVPYWEGPVRASGSQSGVGYLEMTGY
ncbi:iron ABC transporter permease [Pseudomonas sp. LJDD11]|uniref:lipocalin-like domain-containing protein n=1 Tax=Pseudomonas sp. LJDD11 TaxID=2931984 RepID=UPI00211C8D0A|nr:iron ABC transporter permease [Pseudomonas sp. LJDD11]